MVYEDYVRVWIKDMAGVIGQIQKTGGVGTQEQILGLGNMAQHIGAFLKLMGSSKQEQEKEKVKQYEEALGKLTNLVKAFAQRLQQQQQAGNGGGGAAAAEAAKAAGKIQAEKIVATAKAQNMRESHAQRTAQKQTSFELEQQRKDREHRADMRREAAGHAMDVAGEMTKSRLPALPPNEPET
jgi:hypothetical protein